MRGRIPLFVLLASALTFLASLFLPWITVTEGQGLFDQVAPGRPDGWVAGPGDVAVLLVIAIVVVGIAVLRHPRFAAGLPIAGLGVALGYFAVAVAVTVRSPGLFRGVTWTYGFYLGLASAGVVVLSGLTCRSSAFPWPRDATDVTAAVLGTALLVSFLLPWYGFASPTYTVYGVGLPTAAIVALSLILGAGWLHGDTGRHWRLPLAIAVAVLTGGTAGAVLPAPLSAINRYGMWIGIGCAVSLVALEAARAWPVRVPDLPHRLAAVRLGAAVLLIVALFLPWLEFHAFGTLHGSDGWYPSTGAAAGSLCLLLLAALALPELENYGLDASVAIVIFVSALATAFREETFIYRIGYGAFVGIAAAGVLLFTALMRLRPGGVEPRRVLERAVPLAASILCVAAVIVPSWFVLPQAWRYQAAPLTNWLAVPALLLALYLVRLWVTRVQVPSRAKTGSRLTVAPLVLLTLPSLELIRNRDAEISWGAVILVGLCLLLAIFGWVEESRGLEGFRIPEEIWRIDRLPGEG